MKGSDLLILGGLAIGAYFLYRWFSSSLNGSGGGGGGGEGVITLPPTITESPIISTPTPITTYTTTSGFKVTARIAPIGFTPTGMPVFGTQKWSGTTFGSSGQPSKTFAKNTLLEAMQKNAPKATKTAASAMLAGAAPRMVAKIKAGKVW